MAYIDVFSLDQENRKIYGVTSVPNLAFQVMLLEYFIPRLIITEGVSDENSIAKDALRVSYLSINVGPVAPETISDTQAIILPPLCSTNVGSSQSVLTADVEVIGVGSGLAVKDGDIFDRGSDLTKVLTQLVQKVSPPTYTYPTGHILISPASIQEVGTTLNFILKPRFTQNDGGPMGEVTLYDGAILLNTQTNLADYSYQNQVVGLGNRTFKEIIQYEQGPIKNDNFGNPAPSGRVPAGSVVATNTVVGGYYNFYGPFVNVPTDGQDIRDNSVRSFNSSFILNTGDTALIHVIACPANKHLVKVVDLDALNLIVTGDYVYTPSINKIPDAEGNLADFKVYISQNAAAYPTNHRHSVTIG